jgi:muramoyltetrapeptide carboxypeptidase
VQAPASLAPFGTLSLVAPASPFPREGFLRGAAWLAGRYALSMQSRVFERQGYLAGADPRRREELQAALDSPSSRAIWAARGGFGVTRILPELDWTEFTKNPKWLLGFSDITALHLQCQSLNVCSLHAPNVTGIAAMTPAERMLLMKILEGHTRELVFRGLAALRSGTANGTLFGGNLSLVVAEAAAQRLRPPKDAIWILEDVTERPYRIDRMLTALLPYLQRARGIVFGEFAECGPGPDGVLISDVLSELKLNCPVFCCDLFGHGKRNSPMVLGSRAELSGGSLTLAW